MKKLSSFILLAIAGMLFGACSEYSDYDDWADPQHNDEENAITLPGFTASAVDAINLADVTADSVAVFSVSTAALPEGYELTDGRIKLMPEGVENATASELNTTVTGVASKADLQSLVETVYGKAPEARTFSGHVYMDATKNGTAALIDAGEVKVVVTPVAPDISQHYYIVGGTKGWNKADALTQPFSHSETNVYDDPVFTITIPAAADGDTWFAIGDDQALDAMEANDDTSRLLGTTKGNGKNGLGTEESMDFRSNLEDDGSFCVPASTGAKYIRVQINMLNYTYIITPLNFPQTIYEIGNETGWSDADDKLHPLVGSGDGKYQGFYYLDGEFKFRQNAKDWTVNWGASGTDGVLADNGGNLSTSAGFYQIDVDLATLTYTLTEVNTISVIGNVDGWADDQDLTYNVADGAWEATGVKVNGEFKLRMNHAWEVSWGGPFDNLTSVNGGNMTLPEGTYTFKFYLSCEGHNRLVYTKE